MSEESVISQPANEGSPNQQVQANAGSNMAEGDQVGGDKIIHGDEVHGDKVEGDKIGRDKIILHTLFKPSIQRLHQLPPPPRDFTGRKAELAKLAAAIKRHGVTLIGLQGMGGIGKTALALKLAEQLTPRYPDAQFYLDLKGTSIIPLSPSDAMAHIIRAYHPTAELPDSQAGLQALYYTVLHGQCALLLMDNIADREQIEPMIPPDTCLLLITSRQHFTLPGLYAKNMDALPSKDARALLLKIAPRTGDHAEAIAQLCGYLPLALRLAGSAVAERATSSIADYIRRLQEVHKRLELVEASLALSYDLLKPEKQRLWAMLSVFPATFDLTGAASVWEMELDDTQDTLDSFVRYSLVEWNEATSRCSLHDLSRIFAADHLSVSDRVAAQHYHAKHYENVLRSIKELGQSKEVIERNLALFDLEWDNIQAGQAWTAAHAGENDAAAQLCSRYPDAGGYLLFLRQHPREHILWRETALNAARRLKDRSSEAAHLSYLGNAYKDLGKPHRTLEYYEQQRVVTHEIHDQRGEGRAFGNLGAVYADLGDARRAVDYYKQALTIAQEIGDRQNEGNTLTNLGVTYADLGDAHHAIECHEQALIIAREIGSRVSEGYVLGNLGSAYASVGDTRRAIELYEQRLAIVREIGNRRGECYTLNRLSLAYVDLNEPRQAIEYAEQSLTIAREIGNRRGEGNALGSLGLAYMTLGDPRKAIEYDEQSLVIEREIADQRGQGNALWNMSLALDKLGERDKAIANAETALTIFEQIESPYTDTVREQLVKWRGEGK